MKPKVNADRSNAVKQPSTPGVMRGGDERGGGRGSYTTLSEILLEEMVVKFCLKKKVNCVTLHSGR